MSFRGRGLSVWPEGSAGQTKACAVALPGKLAETVPAADRLPVRLVLDAGAVTRVATEADPVFTGEALERLRLHTAPHSELLQTAPFEAALKKKEAAQADLSSWRAQIPREDRVWSAEIRTTTVLFAQAETAALSASDVQAFAFQATRVAHEFGARVLMTGLDDKGLLAILAWGLPGSSSDGESDLAIAAAEQLAAASGSHKTNCSIARGRGFCGVLGGQGFAKYTVLGHHVNNAAGALRQAQGGVVCDPDTRAAARRYNFAGAEQFQDKTGRLRDLFRPKVQADSAQVFHAALVGREDELSTLQSFVDGQGEDAARITWVVADAGLGKSHLLAEFQTRLAGGPRRVIHLTGDRLRQMGSYLPWQPVFAGLPASTLATWSAEEVALLSLCCPMPGARRASAAILSALRERATQRRH